MFNWKQKLLKIWCLQNIYSLQSDESNKWEDPGVLQKQNMHVHITQILLINYLARCSLCKAHQNISKGFCSYIIVPNQFYYLHKDNIFLLKISTYLLNTFITLQRPFFFHVMLSCNACITNYQLQFSFSVYKLGVNSTFSTCLLVNGVN